MPKQTALNCEYIVNCLYSNIGNSALAKAKAVSAACLTFAPLVLWQVRQLWQLCATPVRRLPLPLTATAGVPPYSCTSRFLWFGVISSAFAVAVVALAELSF